MIYGSVCSGIEAATQAWHPLGWTPAFFSEVEKFPSAVLAHHYGSNMPGEVITGNGVPNYGDMTNFKEWPDHAIDVLVGGTPCQSFSVAGLRKGLADPRGNLMLTFGAIAQRYKPKWIVWENVPGVLSSDGGRDFGTFLRLLGECGYGFAYRVLDAQYVRVDGLGRAVPQRRRRVFVVGCLGDWRSAAAVLSEPEGLSGNPAPRREAGKGFTDRIKGRAGGGSHWDGSGAHPSLNQSKNDGGIGMSNQEVFSQRGADLVPDVCKSLLGKGNNSHAADLQTYLPHNVAPIASTLNAAFGDKQGLEDQHINSGAPLFIPMSCGPITAGIGKGRRGTEAVDSDQLIAFSSKDHGGDAMENVSPTVRAGNHDKSHANSGQPPAIAFKPSHYTRGKDGAPSEVVPPLSADADRGDQDPVVLAYGFSTSVTPKFAADLQPTLTVPSPSGGGQPPAVAHPLMAGMSKSAARMPQEQGALIPSAWAVRRLTPTECERLQGFPDDFTRIPWRNRDAGNCPDGPRYKTLGNSMAVNCMRWIGQRIEMVEALSREVPRDD